MNLIKKIIFKARPIHKRKAFINNPFRKCNYFFHAKFLKNYHKVMESMLNYFFNKSVTLIIAKIQNYNILNKVTEPAVYQL